MTGFLVRGVVTAKLMAPPQPGPQVHAAPQPEGQQWLGFRRRAYPAAMLPAHPGGAQPTGPGAASLMMTASTMPGMPSTRLPPRSGSLPASSSAGLFTTLTVAMLKLPQIGAPANPVPIIQPTDPETRTSPRADPINRGAR